MAFAYVNSSLVHQTTTATTIPIAFTPAQSGNLLIVSWEDNPGSSDVPTIADTNGNQWIVACPVTLKAGGTSNTAMWYCTNCKAGATTITVTAASCTSRRIIVSEFSGQDQFAALEQHSEATGTSASPDSGAKTITTTSQLIYGFMNGNSGEAAGAGFTADKDDPGSGVMTEYKVVTATGSYSATFTQTSGQWACEMATFKVAAIPNYRIGVFSKDAVLAVGAFDMGIPVEYGLFDDDLVAQFSSATVGATVSGIASVPPGVFSKDATLDGAFDD